MNDSRAAKENIQDALEASESKRMLKINIYNGGMTKGHGDQVKELPVTKAEIVWATKQSWIKILSMK